MGRRQCIYTGIGVKQECCIPSAPFITYTDHTLRESKIQTMYKAVCHIEYTAILNVKDEVNLCKDYVTIISEMEK